MTVLVTLTNCNFELALEAGMSQKPWPISIIPRCTKKKLYHWKRSWWAILVFYSNFRKWSSYYRKGILGLLQWSMLEISVGQFWRNVGNPYSYKKLYLSISTIFLILEIFWKVIVWRVFSGLFFLEMMSHV